MSGHIKTSHVAGPHFYKSKGMPLSRASYLQVLCALAHCKFYSLHAC